MIGHTFSKNTHTHTSVHIFFSHKPVSTHAELLPSQFFKRKQGCWEIYVETYAGIFVAEALIRLRNLVSDPPSKPSSDTHTHTPETQLCARRCLSCKPLEMCVWNSSWSGEINCNVSVINGVNLWVGLDCSSIWLAQSVDCANDSLLFHASLSLQPKGNAAMISHHN